MSSIFIPDRVRNPPRTESAHCLWCLRRAKRRELFKLVNGPVNHYFCNDDHAIQWCDARHSCIAVNAMLRLQPEERMAILAGRPIEQWVAEQINLTRQQNANAEASDGADGVRDVASVEVPVSKDA